MAADTRRPGPKPVSVVLTGGQRKLLEQDARKRGLAYGIVIRARIILTLSRNPCVSEVARELALDRKTVRFWRDRYLESGRKGLDTRKRPGRPVSIHPLSRCQVLAMACGRPSDFGVEFRPVWSLDALLSTYRELHPDLDSLSRASVWRILNHANLRPHRLRLWLHSPDPKFREKVSHLCQLYLHLPDDSLVLCIDEKTGMQALGRVHPIKHPRPGQQGRLDFEYVRNGTRTLIAAFNPHTGEVYGQVRSSRTAEDLVAFMEAIAARYPDKHVHVVWDNLNIHFDGKDLRWTCFNARHGDRFHFHYTPIHASWVNQIELWFGILHRRVLKYAVYDSTQELETAVTGFIASWNRTPHPFEWKFKGYPLQIGEQAARS